MPQMTIEHTLGGTVITGQHISVYRMLVQRSALALWVTHGIQTGRGMPILKMVKREYNLTGNKHQVLAQFSALVDLARVTANHNQPRNAVSGTDGGDA
jgi:hypothetical protein